MPRFRASGGGWLGVGIEGGVLVIIYGLELKGRGEEKERGIDLGLVSCSEEGERMDDCERESGVRAFWRSENAALGRVRRRLDTLRYSV